MTCSDTTAPALLRSSNRQSIGASVCTQPSRMEYRPVTAVGCCSVPNINAPSEFPQPLFDSGNRERGGSSGPHICPAQQPNCDSSNNWRELSANGSGAATCIDQSQQADNTGGQRHDIHHIEAMKMKIHKTKIILMLGKMLDKI